MLHTFSLLNVGLLALPFALGGPVNVKNAVHRDVTSTVAAVVETTVTTAETIPLGTVTSELTHAATATPFISSAFYSGPVATVSSTFASVAVSSCRVRLPTATGTTHATGPFETTVTTHLSSAPVESTATEPVTSFESATAVETLPAAIASGTTITTRLAEPSTTFASIEWCDEPFTDATPTTFATSTKTASAVTVTETVTIYACVPGTLSIDVSSTRTIATATPLMSSTSGAAATETFLVSSTSAAPISVLVSTSSGPEPSIFVSSTSTAEPTVSVFSTVA